MLSYIHFIRHGITKGIQNKWYYGATDIPLTEEGFKELEVLKFQGIYPCPRSADCYTSGMLRANQTFETIFGDASYREFSSFREMNFGSWECKTFDELKSLEGFDVWMEDKTGTFTFPGGDSAMSFYERVSSGLTELLGCHSLKERTCTSVKGLWAKATYTSDSCATAILADAPASIVVCHGGVIAVCMCILLGIPKKDFWNWIPAPGRGYTVFLEDGQPVKYDKI